MQMVTFESDAERFTVFLADDRAALLMAAEDGAWQDPQFLPRFYGMLRMIAMARLN